MGSHAERFKGKGPGVILPDREIKHSIASGLIIIEPAPEDSAFSSTTLDLTLDKKFRRFRAPAKGASTIITPGEPGFKSQELLADLTTPHEIGEHGYDIPHGELILGWTRERVELTPRGRIAGRVEGKSSLARIGLAIHITAPKIHSGFAGTIQLEIINHGPLPIRLIEGLPICQLVFEMTLGVPDAAYKGQFLGQTPEG